MAEHADAADFLKLAETLPIADVRSPAEFRQGHITGAVNLPLFNDRERAEVGTLYNRSGRDTAIIRGLDISLNRIERYTQQIKRKLTGNHILVHCWRGGMRSENMGALLEAAGFTVTLLNNGYKGYRRYIRSEMAKEACILVLGGFTGSGKTGILNSFASMGYQTINLEKLARHKGSAFGGLGNRRQPTNEQFENDMYLLWSKLDRTKPIWLEDEGRMIGTITLPPPFVEHIRNGLLIRIDIPREVRIRNLVRDYACYPKERLADAIQRIRERLGGDRANQALESLEQDKFAEVAENVLRYYDKAYSHAVGGRKRLVPFIIGTDGRNPARNAEEIIRLLKSLKIFPDDISG